jgi:lipid biosynthesis B12-binding/radical SAM protein
MRILLLSCNPVVAPYPVYPLGMSVIAAALAQAGHAVRQFDMLVAEFSPDKLRDAVIESDPELIGISFRNLDNVNACNEAHYLDPLTALLAAVRAATTAPVVIGGPGFSVMPERLLALTGADYGIVGEGERLAVELAGALARGERPSQRLFRANASLDAAGMVPAAYDPAILDFYQQGGGLVPLQTKRGCPCRCAYCTYPLLEGRRVRVRDGDAVVDELIALQAAGARQIFFTDSIFNDHEGRYRELIAAMRRRGVSLPWTGFFRPEVIAPDLLRDMQATGLNAVELGSDAASDTTLRELGKSFAFQEVEAAHAAFVAAGITVSHYFMMGGPGETEATVEAGIANILRLQGAASFIFLGIRILPGTPLALRALRDGVITETTDLLPPVFYFSPAIEREWLHERLTTAFKRHRQVVYPPDEFDSGLAFLHRLGFAGMSIDLLLRKIARQSAEPAP